MTNEKRSRRGLTPAIGLSLIALSGALSGCDPFPEGGYQKVANRSREPIAEVAAPAPPPYVAGAAGGGAGAVPQLAAGAAPAGVTQAMVEQGAQNYATVCTACHGAGGVGSPAAPALNDAEWLHISGNYEEIVTIILNGVAQPKQYPGAMPPRGGGPFTDEQVRAIAAYVFALSHAQGS